jgi:tetratricopeptide (TPR) repeat protein
MPTIEEQVLACNQQGIALVHQGRLEEAATWFQHAVQLKPDLPAGHNNLGNIHTLRGRLADAVPCYRAALKLVPDDPRTLNNLGNALRQLGDLDEAVACGRRAVALQPVYAEGHSNLGIALEATKELEEALAHCQKAVELRWDFPEGHNNLGLVLNELGRFQEAAAACREALRLRPNYPEGYNNLGTALRGLEQWEDAAACYRQALQLNPGLARARVGLAGCAWRQGRLDEALVLGQEVLRVHPDLAAAHSIMGTVFLTQGRLDEAGARFDRAIELEPTLPDAHLNRALVRLTQGNFEEGWREYEWRWKCSSFVVRSFERPTWDGTSLNGRSILLHAEQGLGDTVQFIRYAPLVRQRGGRVIVACPAGLVTLLSRCAGIDELVGQPDPVPECDTHAPLLSLPGIFGTTLATIPCDVPYLFPDKELIDRWRRELAVFPGFKVGIAWRGNSQHAMDRYRSIPLAQFAPLALKGVHLLSVQKGAGVEQIETLGGRFTVIDLGSRLDAITGGVMDTPAAMKSLDLVITADTAVAHLAGGLGVPVWVALPYAADWRWLLHREDSPWYPTMRLFRQPAPGQWEDVFARMAAELAVATSRKR